MPSSSSIYAKGHELLSMFDIDYHLFSQEITNMLMQNPDARFRLSLGRAPLKKKTKSAKYIQPKPSKEITGKGK